MLTTKYKSSNMTRTVNSIYSFANGMKYTNSPLTEGYAKLLVNYDFKNDGEFIAPRYGYKKIYSKKTNSRIEYEARVLHVGTSYADYIHYDINGTVAKTEQVLVRYALVGSDNVGDIDCFCSILSDISVADANNIDDLVVFNATTPTIDTEKGWIETTGYTFTYAPTYSKIHDVAIEARTPQSQAVVTNLNGYEFCLMSHSTGGAGLFKINLELHEIAIDLMNSYYTMEFGFSRVTPKAVSPTEAVNYGYNMLSDTPYLFTNSATQGGILTLEGVVPYNANDEVCLNARVGETIRFNLVYSYPESETDTYRVQWEVQDLDSGSDPIVVQHWTQSYTYTPGSTIALSYRPAYKRFSLICKVYKSSDIRISQEEWDENENLQSLIKREDYPSPEQVTTLASYTLADSVTTKLSPATYRIPTASGMCTFQQRTVFWGVDKAPNLLFISDVGTVDYVPYPNSAEIFDTDIVSCVPYKDSLLVFTTDTCYLLSVDEEGAYTVKPAIRNLSLSAADVNSIQAIQNMIVLMSGGRVYMIVTSFNNLGEAELKLAPISRPVDDVFEDFYGFCQDVVTHTYGTAFAGRPYPKYGAVVENGAELHLTDFHVDVDDTDVRFTYKLHIPGKFRAQDEHMQHDDTGSTGPEIYLDLVLMYNTVARAWRVYTHYAAPWRTCMLLNMQNRPSLYFALASYTMEFEGATNDYWVYNVYQYYNRACRIDGIPYDAYTDCINTEYSAQNYVQLIGSTVVRCSIPYTNSNVTVLHTGNIDFNIDVVKRIREFRFSVNKHDNDLAFFVDFYKDGKILHGTYTALEHLAQYDTDNECVFYRELNNEDEVDAVYTPQLDKFPYTYELHLDDTYKDVLLLKCKEVGKCRLFSAVITCKKPNAYELISTGYVYRLMNSR